MDKDATFDMDAPECPSFHLTRDQLKGTDFLSFVQSVFREQPDLPMFKIVPPRDWKPTQRRPNLDELMIQTPIKQLVCISLIGCCARQAPSPAHACVHHSHHLQAFGKTGSYRCVLVEDKVLGPPMPLEKP
jgi:hypothetical protein